MAIERTPDISATPSDPYVVLGATYDVSNIEVVLKRMWSAGHRLITAFPEPQNASFLTLVFERREL